MAEEKPSSTAAAAIIAKAPGCAGSTIAIQTMADATAACDNSSQERRQPSRPKTGSGNESISGAQTNLNE